jgi:hypothetical protein
MAIIAARNGSADPGRRLKRAAGWGIVGPMAWLPPHGRRRALVAPGLLLSLALAQIAAFYEVGLSPWKGGGFGMFATVDHGGFRRVRVVELAAGGERPVAVPEELERLQRHAREVPRAANLRRLGEALRARAPGLGALRIEVWRTAFAPSDLAPSRVLVASAELPMVPSVELP